ncbi:hypothetical protein Cgig2_004111 [Carnegiea gigantea]|uniref:Uncharacterized protein n=1 Tax=Carnegiea gigantea TaxID=171969 RepID=A0A9Q1QPK2_9CARY|nr:hypothetical protein Cgig2_004111 [Carnegiea gigantea]
MTASGTLLNSGAAVRATVRHRHSLALRRPTTILPLLSTRKNSNLSLMKPLRSSSFFNHPFKTPNPIFNSPSNPPPKIPFLSDWNKTLAALFALSLSLSSKIAQIITNSFINLKSFFLTLTPQQLQAIQFLQDNVLCTVAPPFCAAHKDRPIGYLNTPLTVVASVLVKWLDIYTGVLMVRIEGRVLLQFDSGQGLRGAGNQLTLNNNITRPLVHTCSLHVLPNPSESCEQCPEICPASSNTEQILSHNIPGIVDVNKVLTNTIKLGDSSTLV